MPEPEEPQINHIMNSVSERYKDKGEEKHWPLEKPLVEASIVAVQQAIGDRGFSFETPDSALSIGSTGILLKVKDRWLGTVRLLKMPRPREGRFDVNIKFIRDEAKTLASLSHDRLVPVLTSGIAHFTAPDSQPMDLHWYIMDFVKDAKTITSETFIDSLLGDRQSDSSVATQVRDAYEKLTSIFLDIAQALSYLHGKGIIHFDVKPDNILVVKDGEKWKGLLSDLGYAQPKGVLTDDLKEVRITYPVAPPHLRKLAEDRWSKGTPSNFDAVLVSVPMRLINEEVDKFMLGFTILEVRKKVIASLEKRKTSFRPHELFEDKYVRLIAGRLIGKDIPQCTDRLELSQAKLYSNNRLYSGLENLAAPWESLKYKDIDEAVEDFQKALDRISLDQFAPELNPTYPGIVQVPGSAKPSYTPRLKNLLQTSALGRLNCVTQLGLLRTVYPGANHTRLEHSLGTYANICEFIRALYNNRRDPFFRSILTKQVAKRLILAALLHDIGYYPLAHDLDPLETWADRTGKDKLQEHYTERILAEDTELRKKIREEWDVDPGLVAKVVAPPSGEDIVNDLLHSMIDGPIDADKMDYLFRDSVHLGLGYGLGLDIDWFLRSLAVVFPSPSSPSLGVTQKGRISAESIAAVRNELYERAYWHHTARAMKAMVAFAASHMKTLQGKDEHFLFFQDLIKNSTELNPYFSPSDVAQLRWLSARADERGSAIIDLLLNRKLYRRICVIPPHDTVFKLYEHKVKKWQHQENLRYSVEMKVAGEQASKKTVSPLILIDIPPSAGLPSLFTMGGEGEMARSIESDIWNTYNEAFTRTLRNIWVFAHPDEAGRLIHEFGPPQASRVKEVIRRLLQSDAHLSSAKERESTLALPS